MKRTIVGTFDGAPGRTIEFPFPPFEEDSLSVRYFTSDGTENSFGSENYQVDNNRKQALFMLNEDSVWPDDLRKFTTVQFEFNSGHSQTSDVPDDIKSALIDWICFRHENPESQDDPLAFKEAVREFSLNLPIMVI